MSREIEDIIKERPDDIPGQIEALSNAAIDNDLHNHVNLAMELHQKAFDLARDSSPDKLPELLPKYILTYYLKNSSNEKAIHEFKKEMKKIENGDEIWEKSKKFYIPEIETTFKKLNYSLKPNFYIQTYFFPELIDYIKSDAEISIDSLLYFIAIAKNCKSGLKLGFLSDLAQVCLLKVSKIENYETSSLRTIDEKKLRDLLAFIRTNLRLGEGKNLDKFEHEIAFKFILSPFLSKQFDGLLRINSNKSFSSSIVSQIQERGVVDHILKSMHQDLATQFSKMLCKLWNAGAYDSQILKQYWNLSLSQHSSVLTKFFAPWPDLVNSIPKSKLDDFWELVKNTNNFQPPVITCLQKVANRASNEVKKDVGNVLWNAMENQDKMDFITVLTEYTPTNSEGRSEVIAKCFALIEKNEDVKFALSLLSHIWKNVDQGETRSKFGILLDKCKPQPDCIQLLFTVMAKMAENYPALFNATEIKKMKKLIKPFFGPQNNLIISDFFKSLINIQKGKLFETDQLSSILKWTSKDIDNVDTPIFNLIILIFGKINNIQNDQSPIPSINLDGIDVLWNLLFSSKLPQVSIYFVSLVARCQDPNAINSFINQCLSKLDSFGSLDALKMLVMKIENPLDLTSIGITRTIFIPQDRYINLNFDGDFVNSLKVLNGISVNSIKSMIASRTNSNESQIVLVKDQTPVENNHIFSNDERITVSIGSSSGSVKIWKKEELPSQILKQPKYFTQLFNLLSSDNQLLASLSLQLLTFLEPDPNELRDIQLIEESCNDESYETHNPHDSSFLDDADGLDDLEENVSTLIEKEDEASNFKTTNDVLGKSKKNKKKKGKKGDKKTESSDSSYGIINWEEKLNPSNRFILLYRLNLLANLVSKNQKKFIKGFFQTGGFKQLISILLNSEERSDILFYSIEMLLKASVNIHSLSEVKSSIYQEIGIDFAISSLMKKITNFLSDSYDQHSLLVLISLLDDFAIYHQHALLLQEDFPRFYEDLLFHSDSQVRAGINRILSKVPTDQLEEITYNHLEKASEGNCNEFFYLLRRIANNTKNPEKLWKLMFKSLEKYIFTPCGNSKLNFDKEEEDQAELQEIVDDLCSKESDETFICGVFEVFEVLLPKLNEEIPKLKKIIFFILNKVIFNTNHYVPYPYSAFSLVWKLIKENDELQLSVLKFLKKISSECSDLSQYSPKLSSTAKVRGLQNMGCTCYLNSSMQQIFRIQNVRDAMLSYKPDSETDLKTDWAAQLCLLWAKLLYAPVHSINVAPFIKNWTGWDGKPINTMEQQDAVEFVQMLLDRIDEKLQDIKPVEESVKGSILHKVKGVSVDFESDSHEPFTTFSLEVNGKANLQESYEAVLIPDNFPNYKASEEIGYIDANSYTTIDKAPEVLIFQLKRFDYDLQTMTRKKINQKYEFSFETDIKDILTENQNVTEPTPCVYELCGVVMHSGSAMGGHYYSYCKNEITNEWCCCNDSNVSPLKTENVISNAIGGIIECDVYDTKANKWVRTKRENAESAYLLIYKKKDREISKNEIEPICLMSPIMLREFLNLYKNLILQNILTGVDYYSFVENLSLKLNDPTLFEYLFDNLMKLFTNQSIQSVSESFNRIVQKKLETSTEFSTYFLSNDEKLINLLVESTNMTVRNSCVSIINKAIRNASKSSIETFLSKILERLDDILDHWKNFDQIFRPIYFYVTEINSDRRDILDSMLDLLNKKIPEKFKDRDLEDFISNVNLSHVFKIILEIITKLNLTNEFLDTIIDETFMNRWFKSPLHTFEFASLVTLFLKDNQKQTDEYLNYINENSKTMGSSTLAAHFANSCTFADSLSEYRVKWFFEKGIPSQELTGYQLSTFISDSAKNVSSIKNKSVCKHLINLNDLWLEKWLISNDASIRRSCKSFIYALFPSFPPFAQSSTYMGYPISPKRQKENKPKDSENKEASEENENQEEKDMILILFNKLLDLSKNLMNACKAGAKIKGQNINKPSEINIPTGDYLEVLAWCTFYGRFKKKIISNKGIFVDFANFFGSMSHELKQSSIDLVHFISIFKLRGFFDSKTLSAFLGMASKIPKNQVEKLSFIQTMSSTLFPLITPRLDGHPTYNNSISNNELIAKSKIVKLSIRNCFDDSVPCSRILYELICATLGIETDDNKKNEEENNAVNKDYDYSSIFAIYQDYLYNEEVFDKYLNSNSSYFFKLLPQCIERNEKFIKGLKSKCLPKISSTMIKNYSSHLVYAIFEKQTQIFNLLSTYIQAFVNQKYKSSLVSDPVKSFISFWKSKDLEPVYKKIIDSFAEPTAPAAYVKMSINFLKMLFTSYPLDFSDLILNTLDSKRADLYEKINPSLRTDFANLTFDMINADNKAEESSKSAKKHSKDRKGKILFNDLDSLIKNELFDPSVFAIYAENMAKVNSFDQKRLSNILVQFMEHCDQIEMFSVADLALDGTKYIDQNEKKQLIDELTLKCSKLMKNKIESLPLNISDKEAVKSQEILNSALNFLEKVDADKELKKINCQDKIKELSNHYGNSPNKDALTKTLQSCLPYT